MGSALYLAHFVLVARGQTIPNSPHTSPSPQPLEDSSWAFCFCGFAPSGLLMCALSGAVQLRSLSLGVMPESGHHLTSVQASLMADGTGYHTWPC